MVDPPPLIRPVEGPVASRFSYDRAAPFRRGRRRVARFTVPSGAVVRAPCAGRVTHAGPTPGGPAVALRCGAWSVTLTGVDPVGARPGHAVRAGRAVARARDTSSGAGVRIASVGLGVRRASDPFGYVDPLPLLRDPDPARRFVPLAPAPRARPVAPVPAPAAPVRRPVPAPVPAPAAPVRRPVPAPSAPVRRPVPAPAPTSAPAPVRIPTVEPEAPLVAWIGLGLAAVGVPVGAVGARVRRRRVAHRSAVRATARG